MITIAAPFLVLGVLPDDSAVAVPRDNPALPLPAAHRRVRDVVALSASDCAGAFRDGSCDRLRISWRERCLQWFYECDELNDDELAFLDAMVEQVVMKCSRI